jgi:GntR family transcriptional regulator
MSEKVPSIQFRLDPRSGVAPYRQLVEQVRSAVASGHLRGGDQLPSVREVVSQITINPNTVHRAYRELEYQGLAEGRPGLGTFITPRAGPIADAAGRDTLVDALREWTATARAAGLDDHEIAELQRRLLNLDQLTWS